MDKVKTEIQDVLTMDIPSGLSSAFDIDAFDDAIEAHGVRFVHYRGMRNPVGMIDKFDSRRPDADHSGASNGLIYTKAGCFSALFTGNSKTLRSMEGGYINAATAQLTPTRKYRNCEDFVYLAPMDRLYLEEETVLVSHQQLVDAHETGVDKLKFPAERVQDIVDATNTRYSSSDYVLENGQIRWTTQNRPGTNPETGKGKVYAVRYLYRPFWYIDRLIHEVRVSQQENPITGETRAVRMPQSAVVQREYVYESEPQDPEAPESPRQQKSPRSGGFGPR
jgi:hypothetical protein